jgi:LPXTG-motif cell wall-anchored protein
MVGLSIGLGMIGLVSLLAIAALLWKRKKDEEPPAEDKKISMY